MKGVILGADGEIVPYEPPLDEPLGLEDGGLPRREVPEADPVEPRPLRIARGIQADVVPGPGQPPGVIHDGESADLNGVARPYGRGAGRVPSGSGDRRGRGRFPGSRGRGSDPDVRPASGEPVNSDSHENQGGSRRTLLQFTAPAWIRRVGGPGRRAGVPGAPFRRTWGAPKPCALSCPCRHLPHAGDQAPRLFLRVVAKDGGPDHGLGGGNGSRGCARGAPRRTARGTGRRAGPVPAPFPG